MNNWGHKHPTDSNNHHNKQNTKSDINKENKTVAFKNRTVHTQNPVL